MSTSMEAKTKMARSHVKSVTSGPRVQEAALQRSSKRTIRAAASTRRRMEMKVKMVTTGRAVSSKANSMANQRHTLGVKSIRSATLSRSFVLITINYS